MPRKTRKIRYAVVGLGHIAQVAMLPAFAHARRNSVLTALVSDDPIKRRELSRRYGVRDTFDYAHFEQCLDGVDAVYIAVPNALHRTFTERSAQAGVHVLCEKPLAVTAADCEAMIAACDRSGVKLMTAYRLHFEQANLEAMELARRGRLGDLKLFNATFSMRVKPDNIRADRELGGGTLYDIGVYCINAARYLFGSEPKEVFAASVNAVPDRLPEIDETTSAILRFDGERVASFVTSFNAADVSAYRLVGTKGTLHMEPAFEYAEGLSYTLTVNGRTTTHRTRKRDQFAAQLLYFSDCVLDSRDPEPDGWEGLQDVRIIEALYASANAGKPMPVPPFIKRQRPTIAQDIRLPPTDKPKTVRTQAPSEE
jgi:glucose-fructose oxidoreductase